METSRSLQQLCPMIPMFIGYFFAAVFGHYFIMLLRNELWKFEGDIDNKYETTEQQSKYLFQPQILGVVERILYTTALFTGETTIIGVWLGLKLASQWKVWNDSRKIFNISLICNVMCLFYSWVGFKLIGWSGQVQIEDLGLNVFFTMLQRDFSKYKYLFIPGMLIGFNLFLFYWVKQGNKKANQSIKGI